MCEALWYFQSKFFGACTLLKSELLLNVSLVDYLVFILIYSLLFFKKIWATATAESTMFGMYIHLFLFSAIPMKRNRPYYFNEINLRVKGISFVWKNVITL